MQAYKRTDEALLKECAAKKWQVGDGGLCPCTLISRSANWFCCMTNTWTTPAVGAHAVALTRQEPCHADLGPLSCVRTHAVDLNPTSHMQRVHPRVTS